MKLVNLHFPQRYKLLVGLSGEPKWTTVPVLIKACHGLQYIKLREFNRTYNHALTRELE